MCLAPTAWQILSSVDGQALPRLLSLAAACIRGGDPFELEVDMVTAGGQRLRAHVTGGLVADRRGRPRTLEGVIRALPRTGTAGDGGESAADLAGCRSALRDWEFFARAIPTELREPLAAIEGFAIALQEREAGGLSARGRQHLDRIRAASAHARSLGEALLLLAPLPVQAIRREPVNLSALARDSLEILRATDPGRAVIATIEPGMRVTGDPDLLRALVVNLLANAWKFTRPKDLAGIDFRRVSGNGSEQSYCVSDNGVGFDALHAAKLFTPFARLHARTDFGGSGLGLCIARRVVERHAGRIWAEGTEGAGAKFLFTLGSEEPACT